MGIPNRHSARLLSGQISVACSEERAVGTECNGVDALTIRLNRTDDTKRNHIPQPDESVWLWPQGRKSLAARFKCDTRMTFESKRCEWIRIWLGTETNDPLEEVPLE